MIKVSEFRADSNTAEGVLFFLLVITCLKRAQCDRFIYEKRYYKNQEAILIVTGRDEKGEAQTVLENAGLWDAFEWRLLYRYSGQILIRQNLTRFGYPKFSDTFTSESASLVSLNPAYATYTSLELRSDFISVKLNSCYSIDHNRALRRTKQNLERTIYYLRREIGPGSHFECLCNAVLDILGNNTRNYYPVFLYLSTEYNCIYDASDGSELSECARNVYLQLKKDTVLIKAPGSSSGWKFLGNRTFDVDYDRRPSIRRGGWNDFRKYREEIRNRMKEEKISFPSSDALCYAEVPDDECTWKDINICKNLTVIPGKEQKVKDLGIVCHKKQDCRTCFDPIPITIPEETTIHTDGTTVPALFDITLDTTSDWNLPTWLLATIAASVLGLVFMCILIYYIAMRKRRKRLQEDATSTMTTVPASSQSELLIELEGEREVEIFPTDRVTKQASKGKTGVRKSTKPTKESPETATVTQSNPFLKTQVATSPLPGTGSNVPPTPDRTESAPFLVTQKATLPLPSRHHTTVETGSSPFLATQKATLPLTTKSHDFKTKSLGRQKAKSKVKEAPVEDDSSTTSLTATDVNDTAPVPTHKAARPIAAAKTKSLGMKTKSVARKSKLVGKQVKVKKSDSDEVVKKQKKRNTKKG